MAFYEAIRCTSSFLISKSHLKSKRSHQFYDLPQQSKCTYVLKRRNCVWALTVLYKSINIIKSVIFSFIVYLLLVAISWFPVGRIFCSVIPIWIFIYIFCSHFHKRKYSHIMSIVLQISYHRLEHNKCFIIMFLNVLRENMQEKKSSVQISPRTQ